MHANHITRQSPLLLQKMQKCCQWQNTSAQSGPEAIIPKDRHHHEWGHADYPYYNYLSITPTDYLPVLAGIIPSEVRRSIRCGTFEKRQPLMNNISSTQP